jgi:hypothetical protein
MRSPRPASRAACRCGPGAACSIGPR